MVGIEHGQDVGPGDGGPVLDDVVHQRVHIGCLVGDDPRHVVAGVAGEVVVEQNVGY
jgi:hypothetical protein